jgi:ribosomal protein L37AE/L43A
MTTETPYYTEHQCTRCGTTVHGLRGLWTCQACGECSPYEPPPEGWQTEIRQGETAEPPPMPRRHRRR